MAGIREAAAVAELVHVRHDELARILTFRAHNLITFTIAEQGFPASLFQPTAYSPSIDMTVLADATFLPNMWQLAVMDPKR